jgi:hypothetical protein
MPTHTRLLFSALAVLALANCKTITSGLATFPNAPVSYQAVSDMIDEETIEHTVKFRNMGNKIISFDYTIADAPDVPHTDAEGPNSGLVENLYPGVEASVKNPTKSRKKLFIVLGKVTYGKQTSEQLAKQYKPSSLAVNSSPVGAGALALPLLEPVAAP